jgi:ADP-heptose:LPS heptosyltransferase
MVHDRLRSLAPADVAPLLTVPGLAFVSLQKDSPLHGPAHGLPLTDVMAEVTDFADTAGLIANLDLVIAADTAVAHLAAAMGKPVWLLDRFDGDWRWLTGRRDSPWYPTLRVYRQSRPGDWAAVVAAVGRDLAAWGADV